MSSTLPTFFNVGSKITLRNGGSTGCPTLRVNVCPSLTLRCRFASTRCPKISWKKTPAARPDRIAGPEKGSTTGAARSRRSSSTIARASDMSCDSSGSPLGRRREVARVERQLHAVRRFRGPLHRHAAPDLGRHDLRTFAVDEVAGFGLNGQRHLARKNELVLIEDRRNTPQPRFPGGRIERVRCRRLCELATLLFREIGGGVFVLNLRGDIGPHARQRLARLLVAAVSCPPQRLPDRPLVVGEREG